MSTAVVQSARLPLADARSLAEAICKRFIERGLVSRAAVAGSVRRGKPSVTDIDLVLCPVQEADLLGVAQGWTPAFVRAIQDSPWDVLNRQVNEWTRRVTMIGPPGRKAAVKVELYLCEPERFGWIQLLRTGPADFTHQLVIEAPRITRERCRFQEGALRRGGEPVWTPDEADVFKALGLPALELHERTVSRLRSVIEQLKGGEA